MQKKRKLGLFACISLVVGNMIGSGIFLLPVSLAAIGSLSLFAWVLTAIGSICLAYLFGELSRKLPVEGGPYAYCRHYLGEFAGYQVSWSYLLANVIGDAATVVALLAYLTAFWPRLAEQHLLSFWIGTGIIWLVFAINVLGLRTFKYIQVATTLIKLTPILLVAILGLFHVDGANLSHLNLSGQSNLAALANAAMLTLFAFGGLESSTIPANAIENPEKTIWKATLIGTLFAALVYILATFSLMGMFSPEALAKSTAPFADAGNVIFGLMTDKFFAIAAIISCFCTITGFMFITGHAAWAAAKDGLLPRFLTKLSKREIPYMGFLAAALVMTLMLGMNYTKQLTSQFTLLITLSNLFILIPYLYTSVSALLSFEKKERTKPMFIAILSCIYIIFAMIGSGAEAVFSGFILLMILTPILAFLHSSLRLNKGD